MSILGNLINWSSQINSYSKIRLDSQLKEWSFSGNVLPDAGVFDISVRAGGSVVSGAVEQGSFTSYNKVTEPLEIEATLTFSGTDTYLQSTLANLVKLKNSVTVFNIITPTQEYENFTLQNYDYSQTRENGRGVLYVKATFIEIKEVQLTYTQGSPITQTQTNDVSATSTQDGGLQQGQTPSSGESNVAAPKRQSILKKMGF